MTLQSEKRSITMSALQLPFPVDLKGQKIFRLLSSRYKTSLQAEGGVSALHFFHWISLERG